VGAEYEKTILDELDLMREAANASQLRRNFAGSPLLYVPEVYWDYCRIDVMVMERIHGVPISDMARLISVRQKEPMGLGHAVLAAKPAVGDEWFGVLLGDDLIDSREPAIGQLARVSRQTGKAAVALMPVPDDQTQMYGVAAGKAEPDGNILVDRIVEKPARGTAPSNLAVIGRYLLPPDIFGILEQVKPGAGGEIQLTDALAVLAQQGRLVGVRFEGDRYDAGDRLGYLQANVAFPSSRGLVCRGH
jgi:UTP--glucose-1-phosphate uridylyltransferase